MTLKNWQTLMVKTPLNPFFTWGEREKHKVMISFMSSKYETFRIKRNETQKRKEEPTNEKLLSDVFFLT